MRKIWLVAVGMGWAAAAWAWPVDLDLETNGLEVTAQVDQIGDSAVVRLTSYATVTVRCELVFRNGPETPRTRQVVLEPGETRPVNHRPQRSVVRLKIEAWCESARAVRPGD
ncbi:MAG: 3-phosphoglycerate kinase [Gammaproteobacteria bacterium]